jgi:hypothetical protein
LKTITITTITMAMALLGIFSISATAYAQTEGDEDVGGCYNVGYSDGQNSEFSRYSFSDNCGPTDNPEENDYYNGFIDGCMSVEGNTRDVCESATDAGE